MDTYVFFMRERLESTSAALSGLVFAAALQETMILGGALNVACYTDDRASQAGLLAVAGALEFALTPAIGRASDQFGRKNVLVSCVSVMAATRALTAVLGAPPRSARG
jgi:MFS family permease